MGSVGEEILVHTRELRFTQASIASCFQNGESIHDAVASLRAGRVQPEDFPVVKVVSHEGLLWSLNNRRLWVFRKAGVPTILVRLRGRHRGNVFRLPATLRDPDQVAIMAHPSFFPRTRGPIRTVEGGHVSRVEEQVIVDAPWVEVVEESETSWENVTMVVDTLDLRFTQKSVGSYFRNGESIHDAVADLRAGRLEPRDFPALEVVRHGGYLWSLNNRTLWVFCKAGVLTTLVRLRGSPRESFRRLPAVVRDPNQFAIMAEASFFPRTRGRHRSVQYICEDAEYLSESDFSEYEDSADHDAQEFCGRFAQLCVRH